MRNNIRNWTLKFLLFTSQNSIYRKLKFILRLNNLSEKDLKIYQNRKLKKLLIHAYKTIPYYKKVLTKAKVVDSSLNVHLENFNKIPVLTKSIIRREGKNLISQKKFLRGYYDNTSGGSTGEPVRIVQDRNFYNWSVANKIFYKIQGKHKIGDTEIRLWASQRDLFYGKETLKIRVRDFIFNRKDLSTFRITPEGMKKHIRTWNKNKPQWVETYVQSIYELAKYIKENNIKVYSPKGILTTAGTLYPEMKDLIEEVFRCKVYNRYGSREVGDIACGENELLISHWNEYIEVLDDNLNEQVSDKIGSLYITNLNNYAMPLIRYQIGDLGVRGKNWRYLKEVKGRDNSLIKTKNLSIDSTSIMSFFYFLFSIKNYQFIQEKESEFTIKVVLNNKKLWEEKEKKIVLDKLKRALGEESKFNVKILDHIAPNKSGKFQYIYSKVK